MLKRVLIGIAAAALSVGLVAGCGGDDDDSAASTPATSGTTAGTASADAAAGVAAAEELGGAVALPAKTVGILQIVGGIESADRVEDSLKRAASAVGWKANVCDGAGDPTKWVTCGNSLLDQGVDAVVAIGIDPGQIQLVVNKAKQAGIPIVCVSGEVPPGYDAAFYPDEQLAGKMLADDVIAKLNALGKDPSKLAVVDFALPSIHARTVVLDEQLKSQPGIDVVARVDTDATNLVPGTRKQTQDIITANPDLNAFWYAFDTAGQAAAPVVATAYPGKEFPDRPLVTTFHADLGTVELMRQGLIDEVLDVNYDASSWMAIDSLAQFFGRDTPFTTDPSPDYPGVGDLFDYQLVSKDNLPPEGEYPEAEVDVVAYFTAKWGAEFTK
jgi:ABC-type sugar transport system substrate-binding protein